MVSFRGPTLAYAQVRLWSDGMSPCLMPYSGAGRENATYGMDAHVRLGIERLSPAQRFMLGSLAILAIGMAGIGAWVTSQIKEGVVDRTAATTALYVDSLVAPPLQDLTEANALTPESIDRLDWLFENTPPWQEGVVFPGW